MTKARTTIPRQIQVRSIRDAALRVVHEDGELEETNGPPLLVASAGRFTIGHMTPFQYRQLPDPPEEVKIRARLDGRSEEPNEGYGYGLDIWVRGEGKVLNVLWSEGQPMKIVSFRRGDWEAEFLERAAAE